MTAALRPTLTMSDVYGPDHVFVARAHDDACAWLPHEAHVLDSLTGSKIGVAGDMPMIVSAGFATKATVDLLEEAGLEFAPGLIPFRAGEALDVLSRMSQTPGTRLVFQHAYPPEAPELDHSWIDPGLLRYLNDKANLPALAQSRYVPPRRLVDVAAFFSDSPALPVVLKASTDQSSGGGFAVRVCRSPGDLREAARTFLSCRRIVAERLLDIVQNPCLNFAVMTSGEARYLGFADQDVTDEGKHRGNWLEIGSSLPEAVVAPAMEVVRRAAEMGYRGFAGIDVAVTRDERVYVLDLNFRMNSSSASVLLAPAIEASLGSVTLHLRKFTGKERAQQMARTAGEFLRRRQMIPLSLFDPEAAGYSGKPPILQALVLGGSREEVEARESELGQAGLI